MHCTLTNTDAKHWTGSAVVVKLAAVKPWISTAHFGHIYPRAVILVLVLAAKGGIHTLECMGVLY